MTRVGFVLNPSQGWLGGSNYYRNLLHAAAMSTELRPVVISGGNALEGLNLDPSVEIIPTTLVQTSNWRYRIRKIGARALDRDLAMERFLRANRIDILSHSGHLGLNGRLPTISWIPDFQHIRLPEFFSTKERHDRDGSFARTTRASTRVIVSSEDARQDLVSFSPGVAPRARVLHFVSALGNNSGPIEPQESLRKRYGIDRPFFYLPNQFWAHKNHAVVVDALRLARSKGRPIAVICTGHTNDHRQPEYFPWLMRRVEEAGCCYDFRVLGLVPYGDVVAFMRYAVAIVNPSLFEGWSTSVEEAKSLGKTVILSDIAVHREQAPEHGVFFEPMSAGDLEMRLQAALDGYTVKEDRTRLDRATKALPLRVAAFRQEFETIVADALGS